MRWFVEISPLGSKSGQDATLCVEAPQWQPALQKARALRGDNGALSNFSIELLDEGYRAIDPVTRLRYVVRRAPDDTQVTAGTMSERPPNVAPSVAPPRTETSPPPSAGLKKRPVAPTVGFSSPGAAIIKPEPALAPEPAVQMPAVEETKKRAPAPTMPYSSSGSATITPAPEPVKLAAPEPVKPAVQPVTPIAAAPTEPVAAAPAKPALPSFVIIGSREDNPTESSPLTYREYVYAIAQGTPEDEARSLILERFEQVRGTLDPQRAGKLLNLAVFDHVFHGRPQRRPVVTLTWKDWKGEEPEIHFPQREAGSETRSSAPAPAPVSAPAPAKPVVAAKPEPTIPVEAPPPAPVKPEPAPAAVKPVVPAPKAEPAPAPVAAAKAEPAAKPAPEPAPVAAKAEPTPVAAKAEPAPVAAKAEPAPVAAKVEPAPVAAKVEPAPVAAKVEPAPVAAKAEPAPVVAKPVAKPEPEPVAAKPVAKAEPVSAKPTAKGGAPAPTSGAAPISVPKAPAVPRKRLTGDDLLAELFEAFGDLHFARDSLEGAEFVLHLTLEKLPAEVGLVSLFDMNTREFVVVRQSGGPRSALCARQPEKAPLAISAMRRRHAVVVSDAEGAARAMDDRWRAVGVELVSLICAPIELSGRYLGLLELANPIDGNAFNEGDGNALTYIGQQFAEFVASHGVIVDPAQIRGDDQKPLAPASPTSGPTSGPRSAPKSAQKPVSSGKKGR